jgi:hypothetical protein
MDGAVRSNDHARDVGTLLIGQVAKATIKFDMPFDLPALLNRCS